MDKVYTKRRIMLMNKKGKDTIILKSVIKMNDTMEMKYTEHKGENCIYYERKILHDMKML